MTPLGEFAQGRFYIFAIVPGILRKFLEEVPLERLVTELSSERVRRCTEKGGNTLDRDVLFVVAEKNLIILERYNQHQPLNDLIDVLREDACRWLKKKRTQPFV